MLAIRVSVKIAAAVDRNLAGIGNCFYQLDAFAHRQLEIRGGFNWLTGDRYYRFLLVYQAGKPHRHHHRKLLWCSIDANAFCER
ncbi:hypothetical protein [Microcoleus sp. FACHB-672]|uniref:hypothetical protein n=1 Tax=Microcoleus sp. FACHB-672 TaxID=2692825 RepID=UPI0016825AB3|nr:hypothetical protein [Microcoleus sp. FACHB-672]MBD2041880.1 hypothetical protein [Microcoleus sp. FACHB-672]